MELRNRRWFDLTFNHWLLDTTARGPLPEEMGWGREWILVSRSVLKDTSEEEFAEACERGRKIIHAAVRKHGHPAIAWAELSAVAGQTLTEVKRHYGRS